MIIKQLSIFVENEQGRLATATELLAENDIDIRALSIADTTDYGILRLIVDDPKRAEQILKENGMTVTLTNVIAIAVPDKPGGLAGVVRILSDANIAIEYIYAFLNPKKVTAFVIMRVEDENKAIDILTKNNVDLMREEEIYDI